MGKLKNQTLDSFVIKRKIDDTTASSSSNPISEVPRTGHVESGSISLERDPGKRKLMWDYPPNEREEIRRAYLNLGPFQIHLAHYPAKGSKHPRKFQYSWFKIFPSWLEYSPTTHSAYCFLCFLYCDKPNARPGADTFIVGGFDKWKKVNDGKRCAFLKHIGCSQHKNATALCENLLNQATHIGNILEKRCVEKVLENRKRLKAIVDIAFFESKIRGQGYDGASNKRGEWNGLQALVLKDCPYAYHIHCFAHRLQLALVAASREVIPVHQFFTHLTSTINVICGSSKRHDELLKANVIETKRLLELGEIKKGKGENQVTTLKRAGDTRWGSHYYSVCSLLSLYNSAIVVLRGIIDDRSALSSQRGDADGVYC